MAIDWEYYKKKAKKIDEENYRKNVSNDIAPVRTQTPTSNANNATEPKWFQKSALFNDGYDFGDVFKTIIGSGTDVTEHAGAGLIGSGEKILDALSRLGTAMNEQAMNQAAENEIIYNTIAGNDISGEQVLKKYKEIQNLVEKGSEEFIKKDLYDEQRIAKKLISDPMRKKHGIDAESDSIFGEKSDELAYSGGQLLGTAAASELGVPSSVLIGLTSFGGEMESALNQGASYDEAAFSSAVTAGAEILTEKISGGIKFGGKTLDEALTKKITSRISKGVARKLVSLGMDAAGEGFEEILSGAMSAIGQKLSYADDKELNKLFSSQDALDALIGGAVLGGFSSVGRNVKAKINGVDTVTGFTKDEQAVFDKVYNDRMAEAKKDGKKLSAKEKSNIYNSVMDDIEKGRISIDTIESVLGGDTYKQYQSAVEKDNSMKKLQKEYDSLYRMKTGDKSDAQIDRQAELKQQLEDYKNNSQLTQLKDKLSKEVSEMAKVSKLSESYNEKTRRSQAFEADLTQYDEKHQGTYKRAIESGILNNTNRTHEFVDLLAKLEADKGVLFDFTNNAKIKETGFAIEGKQVNGYVQGNNIAINIDSTTALNTVVGHEITHVLEGTELYAELANAVKELATTKGEYDSKLQSITKLYEGIEDANIENELTADLIGEYLFTDSEFINKLSAEKPTLFQKIFDEIKYLCKVATAGSKEAKQLEKVKKTFEEAYRQKNNTATNDGVKYSMAGVQSKTADNSLLLKAEQMLESGVDSESVRQETGWYKGYDGEWRYEIDDSKCDLIENPNLEKHEDEFIGTYFTGKVSDVLNHNDLFEAYPQLKDIKIVIQPTDVGLRGRYEGGSEKYIILNLELFKRHTKEYDDIIKNGTTEIKSIEQTPEYKEYNKWHTDDDLLNMDAEEWLVEEDKAREKFFSSELGKRYHYLMWGRKDIQTHEFGWSKSAKEVLMHELQHAIQEIEGFTGGSTPEYWQRKLDSGFTIKSAEQKDDLKNAEKEYYAIMKKDPYFFSVMSELAKSKPNIPRGKIDFNTFEKIEEDPVEWQRYDEIRDRLEKEYGSKAVMDFLRISDKVKNLRDESYTADEAYMQTAGEVEARDTARRLNLNSEQRKNTRPDIDRKDVVFADYSNVGYSIARTKKMSWDEQINGYYKDNNIKIKHSDTLIALHNTPKYMQSDEIKDLPFAIPLSVISKAQKGKNDDHHISDKTIKKLGIAIENPIAIIHDTNRNSAFIITDLIENGKPIVATFVLNDKFDGDDVHRCSSIHKRTDIKKYLENLSNAEIFLENKNKLVNLCREVDILDRLQNNNKLILISLTQKNNNVKEYSLSNANEDIAPVGNNVYGKDIKLQTTSAEDLAPIGENVARKTTESENTIIDGDEPIQKIQSMEKTESTTHEDLVKQMSDIMDEATENDGEENLPDYFVDGQNKKETKSKRKTLHANIIAGFKSKFNEQGFDFDETLKNGKRHSALFNNDNTPQRVLEKTFGYKAGKILSDLTVNKIAQNETEGIKWLNTVTGKKGLLRTLSKEYNIKPGSKESAAAQMYLEGFYVNESDEYVRYGDTELAADFPDRSVRENIRLLAKDPRVRDFYDNSLNAINESRVRNAYDPIPRRDNYALHFRAMEDVFSRIGVPLNPNDIKAKDLPTDLNGVTVDLKPGQPYFASAKHRTGIKTTYDLLGGMERYANSAKNQIYHIDDIQNLRALRNYIADTFGQAKGLEGIDEMTADAAKERIEQVYNGKLSNFAMWLNEEANHIAGKTALVDRAVEGMFSRRAIQFLSKLNGMVGSNQVGFNISSSLTNILPVVQTFAKSNKYDFTKAFSQMITNKAKSISGNDDGFAEKSPVMIRRKGAESFARTPYQKVADIGYVFMSAVDNVATELIARTKFNEYTRKGMDEQKAHIETDKWVSKLMGDRSLGQQPLLYNSKTLGLFTKYQLEVRNQLDSMFYDTVQESKEEFENIESNLEKNAKIAAKVTSTVFQLAVAQHIFGSAFESVAGYNPAFDIIDVILTACGFDDEEDSEDDVLDNLEQAFLELLGDLPYSSIFTGGRIPIQSALPIEKFITGTDQYGNEKSRFETISEALPYYIAPTGYGQYKKTRDGLSMFNDVRELVPEPIREAASDVRSDLITARDTSDSSVKKKILNEVVNIIPNFDDFPISGSYTDSGKLRFSVEKTPGNIAQAALFGQYSSKTARQYFDEEHTPLSSKKTEELSALDISMEEYWNYQKGLKKLGEDATLAEQVDFIANLDGFETWQKNIMANNLTDRKTPIDLTGYETIGDFEEFDFYMKNPEKYAVAKAVGGYDSYMEYSKSLSNITAEKDRNGKTVSGSRKKKVARYINNLDIEFGEKMILYKSEYKSDDIYNAQIVEYLNGRDDITYQEKTTILTELGFNVLSDGTVRW